MELMRQSSSSARRGQIQASDLIVSLSVFLMLLIVAYLTWYRQIDISSAQLLDFRASQAAQRALMHVANSPGFPSNWASQPITPDSPALLGIGAAYSYDSLDPTKLALLAQYYNGAVYHNFTRLKMGISPFEGDVRVSYLNGTNVAVMGAAPAGNDTVLASRQQFAFYQNNTVSVRVRIWQSG